MADQPRKKARGKQPLSRHPLFPGTVALWIGALLGLGGLAIAPRFPMAPGWAVALVLAAIGAFAGLTLARRLAAPKVAETAPAPILDPEASALWSDLKNRRRALEESTEAAAPAPTLAPEFPTIDDEPEVLDISSIAPPAPAEEPVAEITAVEETESPAEPEIVDAKIVDEQEIEEADAEIVPVIEIAAPVEIEGPAEIAVTDERPAGPSAAERIASADLADLSHVELLERLAISLQRRGRAEVPAPPQAIETVCDEPEPLAPPAAPSLEDGYQALQRFGRPATQLHPVASETPEEAPARRPFDAPGAAIAAQDPADTEKALREALSALQRMSGTA